MIKFTFNLCREYYLNEYIEIEAPNLNAALAILALKHDLKDAGAIYISKEEESND